MSVRNLPYLFSPHSVAVIGASEKLHSVGATVLHNLVEGGFNGDIFPVNLKYDTLLGRKMYRHIMGILWRVG
ncbi:MAG TPA: CoA-binding protein [Burkholderiaceae bacterium]|jgi:acetyltransferase